MIDDELITVLQEQRGRVVMTTPVEQIISRGRVVRNRRRVPGAAGAAGVAAAAAVAVGMALPAGHSAASHPGASHPTASHSPGGPGVQLAAWTVTRQADGNIRITFRQATDAAVLQRTLRADGVPVSVTFTGQQNPACRPYSAPSRRAFWPFGTTAGPLGGSRFSHRPKDAYTTRYALVIDASALPSGAGLQIWTSGTPGAADDFGLQVDLVKASLRCTGS
ncbi:MAG TPA: hypothetical protein VMA73_14065 [Streptosporangiaceae bacterium]|nr:hypothetical protein [Streptosporangiaceae bacterium]